MYMQCTRVVADETAYLVEDFRDVDGGSYSEDHVGVHLRMIRQFVAGSIIRKRIHTPIRLVVHKHIHKHVHKRVHKHALEHVHVRNTRPNNFTGESMTVHRSVR